MKPVAIPLPSASAPRARLSLSLIGRRCHPDPRTSQSHRVSAVSHPVLLLLLCPQSQILHLVSARPRPLVNSVATSRNHYPTILPFQGLPRPRPPRIHPACITQAFSTMASSKSKPSPRPSLPSQNKLVNDLETPLRPQVQLRRSGRHVKTMDPENNASSTLGNVLGVRRAEGEDTGSDEMEERKETVKGEMQLAIEGLSRMERRLRSATKRQKLRIEEETRFANPRLVADQERVARSTAEAGMGISQSARRGQGAMPTPEDEEKENFASNIAQGESQDPEARRIDAPEEAADVPERGAARPPPVNSGYLPLPWRGRLGYACLNTYLRSAKTPVFCSRTCRMASIVDHRYPLTDESMPEHSIKNRPDKSKESSYERGQKFLQNLGLQNARDIVKMLRWNDKYGIKFMRLSSEMFPFASHPEHGYKLAPFASEVLAEAGKVAAELGHRVTTHPGQYTQLGSPRQEVVNTAIRDLEYHDEMMSLLRLPEQQNRDAVMILHMGGVFGDKAATLDRFRKNYATLSDSIKARLVLENDDVGWSVHDLLPVCEELNIPLVLDYHHHNIVFDSTQCREGTLDISQPEIMARIAATWTRKCIKQKMHYSEPVPGAVTPRDRRKHSPRVMTLPPCPPDMDLMIEAKDKEQAVFELMRTFKLPGFDRINDMIPHERDDEPRPAPTVPKGKQKPAVNMKRKRAPDEDAIELNDVGAGADDESQVMSARDVSPEETSMGGPDNRVYWPPGREDWLKPMRRGPRTQVREDQDDLDTKDECDYVV
ncbi:UV-endonuclease UvdE-domain-containing protein [Achaetomium macrosporum]|uniref:UV-endonuclease UvdE-domain-containing protein n=1 Tax=Achaetomium macrosporum TaxID=79813 RepID=A0AAN7H828_9PEZI|nr:UV-endonuclease UvdE-domain-containing protein [Achaetomium macrosporum]